MAINWKRRAVSCPSQLSSLNLPSNKCITAYAETIVFAFISKKLLK